MWCALSTRPIPPNPSDGLDSVLTEQDGASWRPAPNLRLGHAGHGRITVTSLQG